MLTVSLREAACRPRPPRSTHEHWCFDAPASLCAQPAPRAPLPTCSSAQMRMSSSLLPTTLHTCRQQMVGGILNLLGCFHFVACIQSGEGLVSAGALPCHPSCRPGLHRLPLLPLVRATLAAGLCCTRRSCLLHNWSTTSSLLWFEPWPVFLSHAACRRC